MQDVETGVEFAAQGERRDAGGLSVGIQQGIAHDPVHHGEQAVGRLAEVGEQVAVARVRRFPLQQFGHAEDAGQRGAHVVGHVGEEGALGPVRGLGELLLAVDLEGGPADAHYADEADEAEGQPGGALAVLRRRQERIGGNGYADAAEHVADLVLLVALQTAFLGGQGGHVAVARSVLIPHQFEDLVLAALEGAQGVGFPRIGLISGTLRVEAGNAETRQRGGEALRDLAGHVGGVDLDENPPVGGAKRAFVFGQPRIGGAAGRFAHPDAAVVGAPVAGIHDAGEEGSRLDAGHFRGVLVLTLYGPAEEGEQQQAPEQREQERQAQHAPGQRGHGILY